MDKSETILPDGEKLVAKARNSLVLCAKKTAMDQHLKSQKVTEKSKSVIELDGKIPIKRLGNEELLQKYVSENDQIFETDGKELFCKICQKTISFDTKHLVYRHLKTKKHNKILTSNGIENESKTQNDGLLIIELLNKYVSENIEAFETDGESLLCKLCKKAVPFDKKSSVERHLKTQKHLYYYAQNIEKTPANVDNKHLSEAEDELHTWEKNQEFCRTCMKQFPNEKSNDIQNITETPRDYQNSKSIMEILEVIQPQIKIELKSNFPTLICSDCIQKLMVSYEFIEMYKNVDKKLRKMLEEFDANQLCNNSVEPNEFLDEMEVPDDFEPEKYEIEIEQVNIDSLRKDEDENEKEWPAFKDEPKEDSTDDVENSETMFSNPYSDDTDDDWIPKKSGPNVSPKNINNSDDVPKRVYKGFFQPEKNEDESLTCELCKSVLESVSLWRKHMRQKHLEEKPRRAYNKRSKQSKEKESHKVSRKIQPNEDGLYKCEYCEKTYPRYIFYRRHLRIHTQEPHLCIECGKSFSLLSSYTSHMLRHKGEKNFKCPHCPKSFVCSSGLYNHAITHTNNKPYVCDICGSAFHMAYQLKKHNRIHTGVKKYQCEYCDMRFITGEKQRRHMRTHTGEKPYRCKYCERAFAQSNDCVKHLRQHLGDNVYQCDLCPLRFPLLRELRVHFASHKDDDEETRAHNLQARKDAEKNLQIKLNSKETANNY